MRGRTPSPTELGPMRIPETMRIHTTSSMYPYFAHIMLPPTLDKPLQYQDQWKSTAKEKNSSQ